MSRALEQPLSVLLGVCSLLLPAFPAFAITQTAAPDPFESHSSGDWGKLERFKLTLEPPNHLFDYERLFNFRTEWQFQAKSIREVQTILEEIGFSTTQLRNLAAKSTIRTEIGKVVISPSDEIVTNLSDDLRSSLYLTLREFGFKDNPYLQCSGMEDRDFGSIPSTTALSKATVDLVNKLTWQNGKAWKFSDTALVLKTLPEVAEKKILMRALNSSRSYVITLSVDRVGDFDTAKKYWAAGGKNPNSAAIIESLSSDSDYAETATRVDIANLLPPVPRQLLHIFTPLELPSGNDQPDCFWTAFNFFNDEPSDRHHDHSALTSQLGGHYTEVVPPLAFGDLILLFEFDPSKKSFTPIHACNFIAANMVFTKNGKSLKRPWVFNDLDHMIDTYSNQNEIKVRYYRLRE